MTDLFKTVVEMPPEGNNEVVRTAMTPVEKHGDPIIVGEKLSTPHDVVHVPRVNRGKHY